MLDIGGWELLVLGVIALLVIGPNELPRAMRNMFGLIRKVRTMAGDFQNSMEDIARESDLADIRKEIKEVKDNPDKILDQFGLDKDIKKDIEETGDDLQRVAGALRQESVRIDTSVLTDTSKSDTALSDEKAPDEKPAKKKSANKKPADKKSGDKKST